LDSAALQRDNERQNVTLKAFTISVHVCAES
jgi:hypothetical protein